jgi:hypothetical protein
MMHPMIPGRVATSSQIGVKLACSPVIYQPITNGRIDSRITDLDLEKEIFSFQFPKEL